VPDPDDPPLTIDFEDSTQGVGEDSLLACPRFTRTDRVRSQGLIDRVDGLGDGLGTSNGATTGDPL
jgi:hypothetical protein